MKNFDELYEEIYKSSIDNLKEAKRKTRRKIIKKILIMLIGAAITFISAKVHIETQNESFLIKLFIVVPIFVDFFMLQSLMNLLVHKKSDYASTYKENVIKKLVKGYSDKLEYFKDGQMRSVIYNASGLCNNNYDIYYSEDYIKGPIFDNCLFSMAEVHTQTERTSTDSNGKTTTYYSTLFHGIFSVIYLPKVSNVEMKILKGSFLSDVGERKNKLEMDSSEFEKIYDVITNDKIQSMRILTADVMQELINFKNTNEITPEISIKNNAIYIIYNIGKVFEPSSFGTGLSYDRLKKYYNILNFTIDLTGKISKSILDLDEVN